MSDGFSDCKERMSNEYLNSQIETLEKQIKIKTANGYKPEDLASELHDLAVFKDQLKD